MSDTIVNVAKGAAGVGTIELVQQVPPEFIETVAGLIIQAFVAIATIVSLFRKRNTSN